MIIKGKPIKGYCFADGCHWYWGETEVAVIDDHTGEIEWCDRKFKFPDEVIQAIRERKPKPDATWIIEARRISHSATQGSIRLTINGKHLITFGDDKKLIDGEWQGRPDSELGSLVCAAFWNPYDDLYHYSDRAKELFKST